MAVILRQILLQDLKRAGSRVVNIKFLVFEQIDSVGLLSLVAKAIQKHQKLPVVDTHFRNATPCSRLPLIPVDVACNVCKSLVTPALYYRKSYFHVFFYVTLTPVIRDFHDTNLSSGFI